MKKEINSSMEILKKIHNIASQIKKDVVLMEVCGTHTQTVSKNGIRRLLPKNVKLLTGPGCPVCVTSQEDIDAMIHLAKAGIPIATYGDMLRVPGFFGSLEQARADGAKVFSVYSIEEAIEIKKDYPNLVFFGLGFDTTTPMTVLALKKGLTVYSTHKLFLPAMDALLAMGEIKIDGFISPGHVSAIVGTKPYEHMNVAQVITGFEAQDVLVGIYMILRQIKEGRRDVENEYIRLVKKDGNKIAQKMIAEYFKIGDGNWRGFGIIPNSGLEIKNPKLNAKIKYKDILSKMDISKSKKPTGCRCGEVIRGLITPNQCPMFGKICTPEKPYGPCMVSDEGGCNNYFRYAK
ncbi:MAG: hydrogenase formation protein HypD [Candidatus Moranbacteria bacterium]|nr:hydrogenase formation protein HypD [Candidatus Moranbacteria bacterium]